MSGLDNLYTRLSFLGGKDANDRANVLKVKSLEAALKDAYQSSILIKGKNIFRGLINSPFGSLEFEKSLSTLSINEVKEGDVLYCVDLESYLIIAQQDKAETAYFKALTYVCNNVITINGNQYNVYVGSYKPESNETSNTRMIWNSLDSTVKLIIVKNIETTTFLKRPQKIKIDGNTWKVHTTDALTFKNVLIVSLEEDYNNKYEDLIEEPAELVIDTSKPYISGSTVVNHYDVLSYLVHDVTGGEWTVSNNKAKIVQYTDTGVTLEIVTGLQGSFDLIYTVGTDVITLPITIKSL